MDLMKMNRLDGPNQEFTPDQQHTFCQFLGSLCHIKRASHPWFLLHGIKSTVNMK